MGISSALSLNTIPTDHQVNSSCLTDITVFRTQSSLNFFSSRQLATTIFFGVVKVLE
jgi:hypothetical protein